MRGFVGTEGVFAFAFALAFALPVRAGAQQGFADACRQLPTQGAPDLQVACLTAAQGAAILQPRVALALAGGNPLPGSASTLGFRLPGKPRIGAQLRTSGAFMTLPPLNRSGNISVLAPSLDADLDVGVFDGLAPVPTVSGIGSLDLLGTLGLSPGVGGFQGTPVSLGLGARLGVLRESFTLPGVTLSVVLRRVGATAYGSEHPPDTISVRMAAATDWSLRAVVGKRLLAVNTTAGVGLDRVSGDVRLFTTRSTPAATSTNLAGPISLVQTRPTAFGALTWTSLVFSATAEAGWQKGGDGNATLQSRSGGAPALPTGSEGLVGKGGFFASLALRLTI